MTQACPGVCNSAYRATGEGQPRPGDPVWCPSDAARIRRQLGELDDLAALLEYQVTGFHEQARSPARGGVTPSPSQAGDELDELLRMLLAWEDAYRDVKGWPSPPRRGVLATVTTTVVAWLASHLDGILNGPFAADFGLEVGQWHRELVAKTRAGTGRRLGVVPCPKCGLRLLAWQDGYDGLICGGCGRYVTRAEYDGDVTRELERAG